LQLASGLAAEPKGVSTVTIAKPDLIARRAFLQRIGMATIPLGITELPFNRPRWDTSDAFLSPSEYYEVHLSSVLEILEAQGMAVDVASTTAMLAQSIAYAAATSYAFTMAEIAG
jgi:hypothetical protein